MHMILLKWRVIALEPVNKTKVVLSMMIGMNERLVLNPIFVKIKNFGNNKSNEMFTL